MKFTTPQNNTHNHTHTCMISHTIIAEFLQFHHLHKAMNKTYWKLRIWLSIAEEIHSVSFDRRSGKFHFVDVENSSMHRHFHNSILFNFIRVVFATHWWFVFVMCSLLFENKSICQSVRTEWVSFFPISSSLNGNGEMINWKMEKCWKLTLSVGYSITY